MDSKPTTRTFRRQGGKLRVICSHCGAPAREGEARCRACAQEVWVSPERLCAACAARLRESDAARDRRGGVAGRVKRGWRLAILAGLGVVFAWMVSALPGSFAASSEPNLAGVRVGDPPRTVERVLGAPDDRGSEILWQGVDGRSHHMIQWQYGLDETQIADLTITFVDGKVHQVGALAGDWQTSDGLRIGDSLAKANRLYGTAIEDPPIEGLTPHRYIRGHVVVRVITEPPSDRILAIGVESPKQIPLEAAPRRFEPDFQHPPIGPQEPDSPPLSDTDPALPRQRYY